MKNLLKIYDEFKERGYVLESCRSEDKEGLYEIFRDVVDTGTQFPYESNSREEFDQRFFGPQSHVYVCLSAEKQVVGGFYIRTNCPGRSSHIANAAYMVHRAARGKGLGRLLAEASLLIAKELGYQAMQFNMVFSQNHIAINLYKKLGFEIIGTIPKAIRNPDGTYQSGYIMFRHL